MTKKEEMNDILQYLLPQLTTQGIQNDNCKVDVTTDKSGNKRGDVWISTIKQTAKDFEKNIIALIEAKHRNATIGDMDWRDAMRQGKEKALKQGLNYYIATNCQSQVRYYNAYNDEEIILDGKVIVHFTSMEILQKIQTQVNADNSFVVHQANKASRPYSESRFRKTLKNLEDIYRSAGLRKGDDRIDPTVSFVVLKHISDQEKERRTLDKNIRLWNDLREMAYDRMTGDLKVEFEKMVELIWGKTSAYRDNIYADFRDLIVFGHKLKNEHFKSIYKELDVYPFHGAYFDLFGTIYETFASQTKKKEFGEFYTRRHITNMVAKLLLRNEIVPRALKVCDPACGTGGFLTEAYKTLITNYSLSGKLTHQSIINLQDNTFWGFDNDEKSIARTKLNMFLVGDGHIHILEVDDSLVGWNQKINWIENSFDYVLTNPPMGEYEGEANIDDFSFTNESRYELLFMEKVIKATKMGEGEIAIVMNDGALESPTRMKFREKLLTSCDILAIVSLTKFAFAPYTKEKTYILFLQRKRSEDIGTVQEFPIWHYILDYDGFANSDKRYRTKYHDDMPELEALFDGAVKLAKQFVLNREEFDRKRADFEREINSREKEEGLWGKKSGFVEMKNVTEDNFLNLLSEYYLRPIVTPVITMENFEQAISKISKELNEFYSNAVGIQYDQK